MEKEMRDYTKYGEPPYRNDDGEWISTVCYMCFNACQVKAHVIDGRVVEIAGDPASPYNKGKICAKGLSGITRLYAPHRVKTPLRRTNPEKGIGVDPGWVEISWEEALTTICQRLEKIRKEDPRKLFLCGIDYHVYIGVLFFMNAFGTPNIWQGASCYWCGNNVHTHSYMYGGGFFHEPDYKHCQYLLLVGAQYGSMVATSAVPLAIRQAEARKRGMKIVVVDPVCVNIAGKADEWIPIRPGTDAAFALGVVNVLVNELGAYDEEFLLARTNAPYLIKSDGHYLRGSSSNKPLCWDFRAGQPGPFDAIPAGSMALEGDYEVEGEQVRTAFSLFRENIREYTPKKASEITTIPPETIKRIAREWAEAANIGSKITIRGRELPLRPVCCIWSKGPAQHWNAFNTGTALQMLNVMAGNIGCPGGYLTLNPVGPFWSLETDPDGLLRGAGITNYVGKSYPARKVVLPPLTSTLAEFFPVALYNDAAVEEALLRPEKYQIPCLPEVMINFRTDIMTSTGNPERIAYLLKKFDFIVSFAIKLNATTEFADIVLPDTMYLERLEPFPNLLGEWTLPGMDDWHWTIRQPVVRPPEGIRPWFEVLMEIADRLGILPDYYHTVNSVMALRTPFRLNPDKKYDWEEIVDRIVTATTGIPLREYKKKGFIRYPKKLEEAYFCLLPNLPRVPIYLEHLVGAGEDLRKATRGLGIDWDTSQFVPIPKWFSCPDFKKRGGEYDLYAVNWKVPTHTFACTIDEPWLAELGEYRPEVYSISINSEKAKMKGLKDGDEVWLEAMLGWRDSEGKPRPPGKVKGKLYVREGIHPECVGIAGNFGHWTKGTPVAKGKGVHFNTLVPYDVTRLDPLGCALDNCILVKIYKA